MAPTSYTHDPDRPGCLCIGPHGGQLCDCDWSSDRYAGCNLPYGLHDHVLSCDQYTQRVVRGNEGLGSGDHTGIYEREWDRYASNPGKSARHLRLYGDYTCYYRSSFGGVDWPSIAGSESQSTSLSVKQKTED